jgi:hypothetical protein
MARSHIESIRLVRKIKKIQVYSPTQANRESYAREIKEKHGIETVPLNDPLDVYKDADILAGCTDANVPVILGKYVEKGTHIVSVGGRPDQETFKKVDRFLRLGNATAPVGQPEVQDEFFTYAVPQLSPHQIKNPHTFGKGTVRLVPEDRVVHLKDILEGKAGRTSPEDITYSERGNLQGAQFHGVAGRVYELAKERGLGKEIPTEWFLQNIRD